MLAKISSSKSISEISRVPGQGSAGSIGVVNGTAVFEDGGANTTAKY
jgi:hypothetical protein